jgi:protein-S-isoprenylcysteine O-methyltransferase Ste14
MSFVPALKIGIWNAWLLTILFPLHPLIMMLIVKDVTKKMKSPVRGKTENLIFICDAVVFFGLFIYSIFIPLKLGTLWFYIGLAMWLVGVIAWITAMVNIRNIPVGEAWTKGLYRHSRHPMVLSSFFILIGAGIASLSWIFLLFSLLEIVLSNVSVNAEERFCVERYGDAYRNYMDRTPKWIGMPKAEKK